LNGTFVNGFRIGRTELAHGDEVQIGSSRLLVLLSCL
jgi:pSer/pThr/pTyr-binding forkhead associated (FHA) protein